MQIARSPLKVHVLSFCKRLQQEVCPITGPTQLEKNLIRFAFQVSKTTLQESLLAISTLKPYQN